MSRSSRTAPTLHTDRSGPGGERTARRVALDALRRIEADGAYANLVLGPMLATSGLTDMDRRFVTELVYGTTRMRRACDSIVDRFVTSPPDDATRSVLRLGAYQLVFAGVPPHAAVGETVGLAPKRTRGFVNAVLRKVSRLSIAEMSWPSDGARLSYPDWIVDRFRGELGDDAVPALERMNEAPSVTTRADGYVQDESSQWVAAAVGAAVGERVLDVCAAPGGKATAMAGTGARGRRRRPAARAGPARPGQRRHARPRTSGRGRRWSGGAVPSRLLRCRTARRPVLRAGCAAPPRRRPVADRADDVVELAELQARLLASAAELVAPGGRLVYSVCTITAAESVDHATPDGFEVDPTEPPVGTWRPFEQGWRVLPQDADTDGMVLIRYRRVP